MQVRLAFSTTIHTNPDAAEVLRCIQPDPEGRLNYSLRFA
jgi:hypothetical protein